MTDAMQQTINTILGKPYARRLTPEPDGGYSASIQEFPGCFAEGETADDALRNLDAAAASWIEVSLAQGREVREPISFGACSGKIALRIPRGLHQQVAELAELEECSVNQLLVSAISEYAGKAGVLHKIRKARREAVPKLTSQKVSNAAGPGSLAHFEVHQDNAVYDAPETGAAAPQQSAPTIRIREKKK